MKPKDLEAIGIELHGKRWKAATARDLKISYSAMRSYSRGRRAIPGPVEVALVCLRDQKRIKEELEK